MSMCMYTAELSGHVAGHQMMHTLLLDLETKRFAIISKILICMMFDISMFHEGSFVVNSQQVL